MVNEHLTGESNFVEALGVVLQGSSEYQAGAMAHKL